MIYLQIHPADPRRKHYTAVKPFDVVIVSFNRESRVIERYIAGELDRVSLTIISRAEKIKVGEGILPDWYFIDTVEFSRVAFNRDSLALLPYPDGRNFCVEQRVKID